MKKVYIFTENFPYGYGEYSFISEELVQFVKKGYDVTIVSEGAGELVCEEFLGKNNIKYIRYKKTKVGALGVLRTIFNRLLWIDIYHVFLLKQEILKRSIRAFNLLKDALAYMVWVENAIDFEEDALYYTYWYYDMALALCMIKNKGNKFKFITRTHGYDLRHEEAYGNRQPYKWFMDGLLDKIYFISEEGHQYYLKNYNVVDNDRYEVAYLGAPVARKSIKDYCRNVNQYHILTCSSICHWKRLNYLIDALAIADDYQIKWTHIGNGCDESQIKKYASDKLDNKNNINYEFLGFLEREKIFDYYSTVGADCFINISISEGVPVAIMEAMAYGMPIIATNVGGNFETVEDNGILLSPDPTPEETLAAIVKICSASGEEYARLSGNSLRLWDKKFNVVKNAEMFINKIEAL